MSFDAPLIYQLSFTTEDIEKLLANSHHYIVTRGPMIRIAEARWEPAAFALSMFMGNDYLGDVRMDISHYFQGTPRVRLLAGGRYYAVSTPQGQTITHGNAWSIAGLATNRMPEVVDQEVLYIGKAYGRLGDDGTPTRNTYLRTRAHEQIQRIANDHLGSEFDIFLTPLWVESGMWTSDDLIDDTEPGPDLFKVIEFTKPESMADRVALAEQALIAYFQPRYNQNLLEWGRTYTPAAKAMRATGLRVLNVTVTNWNGITRLFSPSVPPRLSHNASCVLGMTSAEAGAQPYWRIGDMGGGLGLLLSQIDESEPSVLLPGTALPKLANLPDEQDMAFRIGSGKRAWRRSWKRRPLRELSLDANPDFTGVDPFKVV